MTETPLPHRLWPETLQAASVASPAPGEQTTTQPQEHGDEALSYALKFGSHSSYRLYARRGAPPRSSVPPPAQVFSCGR